MARTTIAVIALELLVLALGKAAGESDPFHALERGDYNAAIAAGTKALQVNPKDANAYFYRGQAWRGKR